MRDQSNEECFEFNFYDFLYWKLDVLNHYRFIFLFCDSTKNQKTGIWLIPSESLEM